MGIAMCCFLTPYIYWLVQLYRQEKSMLLLVEKIHLAYETLLDAHFNAANLAFALVALSLLYLKHS